MALVVQKYGGSSLATPRHIRQAAERIRLLKESGKEVVVVVSAMGRMTDHLLRLAEKTVAHPPQRELDMLMTAGERVSMSLLAMALHDQGVKAISFTGSQSGIVTSSDHTDARIIDIRAHRIREELAKGKVVIVAGFQGVSLEKEITTLGRGGSDTTAVALAAVLKAEVCEVLTDVHGIYSADPRVVPNATLLQKISYDEAVELASLGAKMQGRSIQLARKFQVPVRVVHSGDFSSGGTEISSLSTRGEGKMESIRITGVASKDGFHSFHGKAEPAVLSDVFAEARVAIRFMSYAADQVSFVVEKEKAPALRKALAGRGLAFSEVQKVSTVSLVGDGLGACPDFLSQCLKLVKELSCPCFLVSMNSISATVVVPEADKARLTVALHGVFVEDKKKEPPVREAPSKSGSEVVVKTTSPPY